jgi:patatin-like phospholipase/acyl hydrolase
MRVLTIDGGGIRGIIPALVLAELEARAGKPVADLFDLVAGTSTGGILACGLGRPGADGRPSWRAEQLVELYRTEGPHIFSRTLARKVTSGLGLLDEKYDDRALGAALERYVGPGRLSDSLVPLLVTAYDLPTRVPFFFKSWRAKNDPTQDFPLAQVARATAAAPTYFEPLCVGDLALVDGGVFATNPAMCAFAEARRLEPREAPFVVSLGTGQLTRPISGKDAAGWGLLEWVRPLIDVVFDGVADTVEYQLGELAQDPVRLQVALTRASDALDDVSARNLALLEEQARELISSASSELDRAVARLVA